MIQAALGGYKNAKTAATVSNDAPIFYEPGFTIVSPLEISIPESDQIYILLRNRVDSGGVIFETPTIADLSVAIKDATTGESVPGFLDTNELGSTIFNTNWDTDASQFNPVVLVINSSIDIFAPVERVRVLDVFVQNTVSPESSIFFRLVSDDSDKLVHYLDINIDEVGDRYKFSTPSKEILTNVTGLSGNYVLFSPFAYLQEVDTKEKSDFSYPSESIFYKRQKTFNDEEFNFSISFFSHSFIEDGVSLVGVPGYKKAALLLIDKFVHTEMLKTRASTYLEVMVSGILSGIEHPFIVNLVR